jgi:CubicO group peptidase (beta-lactamase class C family)
MSEWLKGHVDTAPKDVGYDDGKIARLEAHFGKWIHERDLQGASFLMARHGKVFAHRALGRLTNEPDSPPLKTDSIKGIASITKMFTATAVMRLVENGYLWLEQPVKSIIREFDNPMHGGINLWHLLTHTSGLRADGDYWSEPYPIEGWDLMRKEDWITKAALAGPVQCKPGEQWNYCSLAFAVLGEIIGRVSGTYYDDFIMDEVVKPLGMTRTFMEVPEKLRSETVIMDEWGKKMLMEKNDRKGAPNGGGGVYSSLHDLFKLGQCYLNGGEYGGARILGKKTCQEMTRNQLPPGVPSYHWGKNCKSYRQGLGWEFYTDGPTVGPATYNHEGWGWCSLFVDPVEEFIFTSFVISPTGWNPDLMVSPRTIAFAGIT